MRPKISRSSKNLCECGCGSRVNKNNNRFVHGHNKPMTGKTHSDATKSKMRAKRLANPPTHNIGLIMPEKTKEKISETLKRKIKNGEIVSGVRNLIKHHKEYGSWNKGKKWDDKARKKMSVSAVKRMSKFPTKETKIEVKMGEELKRLKIKFTPQANIANTFVADFLLNGRNTIIECDGDYWHAREKAILKDKRKNGFYKKMGFKFLRFREKDIHDEYFDIKFFIETDEIRNVYYDYENSCYCWEFVLIGPPEDNLDRMDKLNEELNKRLKR